MLDTLAHVFVQHGYAGKQLRVYKSEGFDHRSSDVIQLPKRYGELIYGIAPCLAALQVRKRKIYHILLQEGFEGEIRTDIKQLGAIFVKFRDWPVDHECPATLSTHIDPCGELPTEWFVIKVARLSGFLRSSWTG